MFLVLDVSCRLRFPLGSWQLQKDQSQSASTPGAVGSEVHFAFSLRKAQPSPWGRDELYSPCSLLPYHSQNLISKGSKVNLFVYKRRSLKRMGWVHISHPCKSGVMAFFLEISLCCCNKPGAGYWVLSYHHFNSSTHSYVFCSKIRERNIWQTKPLPNKCCPLALISHSGYWKQMFWCYWDLDMFVFSLLGQLKLLVFTVIPDERCFE